MICLQIYNDKGLRLRYVVNDKIKSFVRCSSTLFVCINRCSVVVKILNLKIFYFVKFPKTMSYSNMDHM